MSGRQRLYAEDKRVTIVMEATLHDKIVKMAKAKGLTTSRFLSLVVKKVLADKVVEQPTIVKVDNVSQVGPKSLEDVGFE